MKAKQPCKQTPPTKENPTRQRHQAASGGAKK
jgi:hypothetical protein